MAILVTTENTKDERVSSLGMAILKRVSSLGTAISVISKNVKDAERTVSSLRTAISERVSSFGIVIGNRGKCEVDTRIDSTHRLVWSTTASVLIFGFGYIGFSFSFWVSDSLWTDVGFGSCMARWIDVGFDSWMLDRCCFDSLTLNRWMSASILVCWIDISFRLLDVGWISTLIPGYQIYIGFDSLALDRWISVSLDRMNFETLKNINSRRDKHEILVTSFSDLWMCKFLL
ncbi:hypothetical protein RhiirA1_473839 [Rhizophagus irregularis]|uniref:Uncharacterized protein n=1 Tax=Rhizophagus irregularis TaxID=588596 RepID=A0A2N0QZR4_9GLOM|nr:hypothetical protein RhiirA1_473839 [Rhizophagus irregularis]